jgi:carbonic anhydrase
MKHHRISLLLCAAGVACALFTSALASEKSPAVSPDTALARLVDGNERFVAGTTTHPDQSVERRTELAGGQQPFAIVLTCSDSRVPPELIFDQGIGDLFVIRNAGNLLDDHVIGSIEYAVEHLHTTLVVVLGHTKCGAVSAAVAGGEVPGHLKSIVDSLESAVAMAKKKPGDAVDNAVRINARLSAAALAQTGPIIGEAVTAGQVKIVAARYDIATGQVEFLP